jgi:hypothetical protein
MPMKKDENKKRRAALGGDPAGKLVYHSRKASDKPRASSETRNVTGVAKSAHVVSQVSPFDNQADTLSCAGTMWQQMSSMLAGPDRL